MWIWETKSFNSGSSVRSSLVWEVRFARGQPCVCKGNILAQFSEWKAWDPHAQAKSTLSSAGWDQLVWFFFISCGFFCSTFICGTGTGKKHKTTQERVNDSAELRTEINWHHSPVAGKGLNGAGPQQKLSGVPQWSPSAKAAAHEMTELAAKTWRDEQHGSPGRSPPAARITPYLCTLGRWRDQQQKHVGKQVHL